MLLAKLRRASDVCLFGRRRWPNVAARRRGRFRAHGVLATAGHICHHFTQTLGNWRPERWRIPITAIEGEFVTLKVGYIIGSLSASSINRTLAKAIVRLAPAELDLEEIRIAELPVYNRDFDADYPPEGTALKEAIASVDAVLFITPEYNRDIPGSLKNAIDWASRPWGTNSFDRKPSAVIGTSPGKIGTAVAQQNLRGILSYCNAPQMSAPEAYIQFTPGLINDDGEVADASTEQFLRDFIDEFSRFITRALTVLPR
ncbi:NADPH-dependent FMN reductase [Dactylosporangium sp. NPDC000521]|uniref:NADPH-dependent FMN reductase n=1 Tax=Dactylosporangium sp. NPDC000521 TaxID=3363975 RepID=UPI0036B7D908